MFFGPSSRRWWRRTAEAVSLTMSEPTKPIIPRQPIRIRPWVEDDLPQMLHLLRASGVSPVQDVLCALQESNALAYSAVSTADHQFDDLVTGFLLVRRYPSSSWLTHLAVLPSRRRKLIGTRLVHAAVTELYQENRNRVRAMVQENDLAAQLFFQSISFHWIETLPAERGDATQYVLEFRPGKSRYESAPVRG